MANNDLLKNISEKISQVIVNKTNQGYSQCILTNEHVYLCENKNLQKRNKKEISKISFIKGLPHGKLRIYFNDESIWNFEDIVKGRVFDFMQELKPIQINQASYDSTIRGEFPQLLDIDHAKEIDKLRRYMQDGNISHYEFDDYNPVYPKAGK